MTGTPPVLPGCTMGTGNSPPARKAAVSPESATKSGSARRRMRPFVSNADRATSRLAPLVARLASATPKGCAPEIKVAAVVNIGRLGALPTVFPLASTQFGRTQPVAEDGGLPIVFLPPAVTEPRPVPKPRFPALFAP